MHVEIFATCTSVEDVPHDRECDRKHDMRVFYLEGKSSFGYGSVDVVKSCLLYQMQDAVQEMIHDVTHLTLDHPAAESIYDLAVEGATWLDKMEPGAKGKFTREVGVGVNEVA